MFSFFTKDRDIAADLIKILKQADQEIPEFLLKTMPNNGTMKATNGEQAYGGRDIRGKNFKSFIPDNNVEDIITDAITHW